MNLLRELHPVVAANLDRHLGIAKEWHPHDYVPWSRGRDFAFLGGTDWTPEESPLDPVAKTAMVVNLLTEDNRPSYDREIATRFGRDGAWGQWVGRWTAEEGRHGIALRDYLVVTRGVDPVDLERARMAQMTTGYDSGDKTPLQTVAYVSFQELATRVSHRNTGRATGCPLAEQLLSRIATDENLHMVFYRNLMGAARGPGRLTGAGVSHGCAAGTTATHGWGPEAQEAAMTFGRSTYRRQSVVGRVVAVVVVVWLIIGAIAAGQRHYYSSSKTNCA